MLILGGTNFIGRNLVEYLWQLGEYEVTLFNRQITRTDLFPKIHKIKGTRESKDIEQVADVKWHSIIDLSCYYPDDLQSLLSCIENIEQYIFVSTCSVYNSLKHKELFRDEEAATLRCSYEQRTDGSVASYGHRKAECERILQDSGLPYTILRPALVFGKYDPTDRLYYWLHQVKSKNQLLLPEMGERLFSTTYVLDIVRSILQTLSNAPSHQIFKFISNPNTSFKQIVLSARQLLQSDFKIVNGSAEYLASHESPHGLICPFG